MAAPPKRRRIRSKDVTPAIIRVITAIDVVKDAVPIQLAQGVLSTTLAILNIVKVRLWLAVGRPLLRSLLRRTPSRTKRTFAISSNSATGSGTLSKGVAGELMKAE